MIHRQMGKMNKTLIIIGLVVSVTLLIFPFVLFYGNDIMLVTSDSMIPTLKPNDLLIVQRTEIDKIMLGDIVVFNSHIEGIGIVAHRAIEKFDDNGKNAINTQGDNVGEADAWVVHEEDTKIAILLTRLEECFETPALLPSLTMTTRRAG